MGLFEAAWVIARRDFIATVYSRSFILFLVVPLIIFGAAFAVGEITEDSDDAANVPVVAMLTDGTTAQALTSARDALARSVSGRGRGENRVQRIFPELRRVDPAENVDVQAHNLLADEEAGYSAVLAGSLERPRLYGPSRIDEGVGNRLQMIAALAQRNQALAQADVALPEVQFDRRLTAQAAGNLQMIRRSIAQAGQMLIFMVTVLLATLLLSNLAEEKTNKIIEVLAASIRLDSIFIGKLIAMLGISLVGLALWGGMIATAYLFVQVVQDFMALPSAAPAVGWPLFLVLLFVYYAVNYLLLGALFLGIGGQASNIREIQTLSMPVTMLQVFVFLLAMQAVGSQNGLLVWAAYILPFSSPLVMVALAAQDPRLWPHLVALAWQALWIVLIVRLSARWFRMTVLKSAPGGAFFDFLRPRRATN
ncbi:MAG: ABC transporter permease [Sphingosinicella sp.]